MKKGYLYIALSAVLFSTMEIALKLAAASFNPIQMTFLRFFIGAVVLLPLAVKGLKQKGCRLNANDFAFFAVTGFICVVVSMVLYQMAILYAHASVVAVLFSCNPVFVVIFAFALLNEKIYKHTVASIALSILGILFIMNPLNMKSGVLGIVLTILSAVTFALYGVVGRRRTARYGGMALTSFSFIFGSAELLMVILITKIGAVSSFLKAAGLSEFASVPVFRGITLANLPSLLYIGVFVTGLGYAFYFLAMEETSASTASLVFFIKPALAPLLALLTIRDPIHLNMAAGILLILAGSAVTLVPWAKILPASLTASSSEEIE